MSVCWLVTRLVDRPIGRSVGWSNCHNFFKTQVVYNVHFNASIGEFFKGIQKQVVTKSRRSKKKMEEVYFRDSAASKNKSAALFMQCLSVGKG